MLVGGLAVIPGRNRAGEREDEQRGRARVGRFGATP